VVDACRARVLLRGPGACLAPAHPGGALPLGAPRRTRGRSGPRRCTRRPRRGARGGGAFWQALRGPRRRLPPFGACRDAWGSAAVTKALSGTRPGCCCSGAARAASAGRRCCSPALPSGAAWGGRDAPPHQSWASRGQGRADLATRRSVAPRSAGSRTLTRVLAVGGSSPGAALADGDGAARGAPRSTGSATGCALLHDPHWCRPIAASICFTISQAGRSAANEATGLSSRDGSDRSVDPPTAARMR